jgi:hypothetical protein
MVDMPNKGAIVFEETMMPSYMPGGIDSYKRNLAMTWYLRGTAALCITLFALIDGPYEPVLIFCLIIGIFGIVLLFLLSEVVYYTNQVLSAMPLRVLENGLIIPPLYFRQYTKKGGFISKEEIDHIVVVRRRNLMIGDGKKEKYWWENAPVEFIVHLKGGKKRRSGPRPPGTIRVVVDTMHDAWGTRIEQKGSGNGTLRRVINSKTIEIREL